MSEDREHPLNTAHGILYGLLLSLGLWCLVIVFGAGIAWLIGWF